MLLVESGESSLFDIIEEVRESQLEQNSEDDFRFSSFLTNYKLSFYAIQQ